MAFQSVYKVKTIIEEEGRFFIPESEVQRIDWGLGKHVLLYFVRACRYRHHSACESGPLQNCLLSSAVEGPFESMPNPTPGSGEYVREVLTKVIPAREMSSAFEPVEYIHYGINLEVYGEEYERGQSLFHADADAALHRIGERALEKIRVSSPSKVQENRYDVLFNGNAVSLYFPRGLHRPNISVQILGKVQSQPSGLVGALGLRSLEEVLLPAARERGIIDVRRKGLAYNLSLDDLDLATIGEKENIIL